MNRLPTITLPMLLLLYASGYASSYMGKVEPYESITIKSQASGTVTYVNKEIKAQFTKSTTIVRLDTTDLDIEINSLRKDLNNQQRIFQIQNARFKQKSKLSTISEFEKQQDELNMRNALRGVYSAKKQLDLTLQRKAKTVFKIKNRYIGNIYVNKGDLVSNGMPIADVYDISKSKIILFIRKEDIKDIKSKPIYINGKRSTYQIANLSTITDKTYISSYRVEIVATNDDLKYLFGEVVKVSFEQQGE